MAILSAMVAALAAAGALGNVLLSRSNATEFSVQQLPNPNYVRHGPTELAEAFLKYAAKVPPEILAAANLTRPKGVSASATGSVVATPQEFDREFLVPVSIGTPPQVLNLCLDTGSSDLWVFSSDTRPSMVNGQKLYNVRSSTTFNSVSGASWMILYGDSSSAKGLVYTDVVNIGGLSVKNQAVESAQTVSERFTRDSAFSGVLGLGFSNKNRVKPTPQLTFFENALSSLSQPVFTADLRHHASGKYNFGFIDKAAFTGAISFTPVDMKDGFWTFTASGFAVGSGARTPTSITGIADTGTTLLLLPPPVVDAYYKQVKGAEKSVAFGGVWTFPCSSSESPAPSFSFFVGDKAITIPGPFIASYPAGIEGLCYGGIQESRDGIPVIFGALALKSAFVVFDGGKKPRLGFATKKL